MRSDRVSRVSRDIYGHFILRKLGSTTIFTTQNSHTTLRSIVVIEMPTTADRLPPLFCADSLTAPATILFNRSLSEPKERCRPNARYCKRTLLQTHAKCCYYSHTQIGLYEQRRKLPWHLHSELSAKSFWKPHSRFPLSLRATYHLSVPTWVCEKTINNFKFNVVRVFVGEHDREASTNRRGL